ncbi:MAG: PSD1 and planctomycete cytochrome C domain-containing protein [Akkermansiaceae bacterium]
MSQYHWLAIPLVAFTSVCRGGERVVSYNRDVRPILSENCFFCHGFDKDKREADLRLDTEEGAKESAITAGNAATSELFKRITTSDPDDVMPPADSVYHLTAEQKETLRLWIEQGANYEEHWAYKKLERPAVPDESAASPIDSFLRQTWKEHGVSPVPKTEPRVLLRRLSFDLRGLPPTHEEVAAFEKDPSPEAYQQLVKQWTESTEHAEHQGLMWLDLVRWADSTGMVSDEPIATGHYRKYVIEAFRDNMPFDRFTREQLAGDLLPSATDATLTASAYNRLVKTNSEAGVIEEEALHALKGEHVRALGTVWLGATTGCAECHDHKYDPISAKDYYALGAFFDDLVEVGVYQPGDRRAPIHHLHSNSANSRKDAELSAMADAVREELYEPEPDPSELVAWEKSVIATGDATKKAAKGEPVDFECVPVLLPPSKVIDGEFTQMEAGRHSTAPEGSLARHFAAEFITGPLPAEVSGLYTHVTLDSVNPPELIAFQTINGAYGRLGWHQNYHTTYYWGPQAHGLLKKHYPWLDPKKLIHMGPLPEAGKSIRLDIPSNKFSKTEYVPVGMAWLHIGGTVTWGASGYRTNPHRAHLNRLQTPLLRHWWELPLNRDDRNKFPDMVDSSVRLPTAERRPIHEKAIRIAFAEIKRPDLVEKLDGIHRELSLLRRDTDTTLVSKTGPRKTTRLRNRGDFMDNSGPVLEPAFLEHFTKGEAQKNLTRLDLADWLTSPENPMTARVFVNRLWHQFYGRGISNTLIDSGNQGDWPSHPDLLDWLAAEFIASGWDVRHMIRLMVSTEAYQLSSIPDSKTAEIDPRNRFITRQIAHRLGAEGIRDTALTAAGVLRKTQDIPTRSFFPYQPGAYWAQSNKIMLGSRYQIWETDRGKDQHQRSLYTYWKRQNPHPSLLAFDAPTRQECTAQRPITNSPAQALALLNDPIYVQASRLLARRAIDSAPDEETRLTNLFRFALQREPSPRETEILNPYLGNWKTHFTENPSEAEALLGDTKEQGNTAEFAAWTNMARLVLNLHEFLTRS